MDTFASHGESSKVAARRVAPRSPPLADLQPSLSLLAFQLTQALSTTTCGLASWGLKT